MRWTYRGWLWGLVAALHMGHAHATLGEAASSIQGDQIRLQGQRVLRHAWPAQAHIIELADGSRLRQFVNAEGQVFAVSWHSRLKPDLQALLGRHYASFAKAQPTAHGLFAARQARQWSADGLVVGLAGRGATHAGWAYVPELTPRGFDVAQLR